jgi:hypothetical protein
VRLYCCLFEDFSLADRYDAVVMNPPFSAPGQPTVWAEHIRRAYDLLVPGGLLVSVAPSSFEFRADASVRGIRELVGERGGWERLPDATFAGAGTEVRTVLLWANKPVPFPNPSGPATQPALF